ncbi:hypothetical protein [Halostella litorea]|uniref:hypothetical protein n=1 Tax=Halostella litorea TaxID=2528831 RepID=UPI0010927A85|nr:hypothetical protein [Halostella litorea]
MTEDEPTFNRAHAWAFRALLLTVAALPSIPYGWIWHETVAPVFVVLALLAVWMVLTVVAERLEGRSVRRQGQVMLAEQAGVPLDQDQRNEWNDPYDAEERDR